MLQETNNLIKVQDAIRHLVYQFRKSHHGPMMLNEKMYEVSYSRQCSYSTLIGQDIQGDFCNFFGFFLANTVKPFFQQKSRHFSACRNCAFVNISRFLKMNLQAFSGSVTIFLILALWLQKNGYFNQVNLSPNDKQLIPVKLLVEFDIKIANPLQSDFASVNQNQKNRYPLQFHKSTPNSL